MKRARVETSTTGLLEASSSLRSDRLNIVSMSELQSLRSELEHERAMRALDEKRFRQAQQRSERHLQFAVEEANEAKAMLDDVTQKSEAHVRQLRAARDDALAQLREAQADLREVQSAAAIDDLEKRDDPEYVNLKDIIQAKADENDGLRQQLRGLQAEVRSLSKQQQQDSDSKRTTPAFGAADSQPPTMSPVRSDLMKELNRIRLSLADAERKLRQVSRSSDEWESKAKQLIGQRESAQLAVLRLEKVELDFAKLRKDHEMAQVQIETWRKFGTSIRAFMTSLDAEQQPRAFDANVPPEVAAIKCFIDECQEKLRQSEAARALLEQQLSDGKQAVSTLEAKCHSMASSQESQAQEKRDMQDKIDRLDQELTTLRAQERIWKRETDSLRSLVDTLDELPQRSAASTTGSAIALQGQLEAATNEIKVLTEDREKLRKDIEERVKEKETIMKKFNKCKEAVYAERDKSAKAEARAIQAETLAGKGAFNPETTKVLHLKSNPLTEALKTELAVLRKQLKALSSEASAASRPATGKDLDPEKLHQRLRQSFKEQIGRFREGVYLLTGYKIDMIPGDDRPTFRVRSMFAEQEQDHLMLRWPQQPSGSNPGDSITSLDIMNTEMARVLTTTPSYDYMTKFHSLPAFMASVQLSLFEKQTMM